MITTAEREEQPLMVAGNVGEHCDTCSQEIADAEKELGAFAKACGALFGPVAAVRAAEYWVELAESTCPLQADDRSYWRHITIMAASRMATCNRWPKPNLRSCGLAVPGRPEDTEELPVFEPGRRGVMNSRFNSRSAATAMPIARVQPR